MQEENGLVSIPVEPKRLREFMEMAGDGLIHGRESTGRLIGEETVHLVASTGPR